MHTPHTDVRICSSTAGIVLTDLRAGEDLSDAGPVQVALTPGEHHVPPIDLTDQVRSDLAM